MLDEVDEDGLGPLQVVDDDHLRPLHSPGLEQAPEGELRLGRRRPDDGVGLDADRDQDLDERPVGDPFAVGEAAAAEDVRRVAYPLEEVRDEPRLADPGRAEQREEPTRAVRDRVLVVAPEPLALSLASDERCLGVTRDGRGVGEHLEEPVRLHRLRLALESERLDRFDADGVADEDLASRTDHDLAGRCRLLETGGDVDGVAGDERLGVPSDDDLAGVDADSRLEPVLRDGRCASRPQREPHAARRPRARRGCRRRP